MKTIQRIFSLTALIAFTLVVSCSEILEEQPRTFYEPGYFKTIEGATGGVTSLYAHLRYIYGHAYYLSALESGTDEYTYGDVNGGNPKPHDMDGAVVLTADNSRTDVLWNQAYMAINTASGIIENATEAGMDASLIAEAYFFRAFDYFQLVQNFGGVPLDLGAGKLKFNTSAARTSVRNTVSEVYTEAIFPDLLIAERDLPATGRLTGTATKTLARLYLSKAYLTYAWWLENPNSIPTYPAVSSRTDPDGHDAQWYFQQAYNVATAAIEDKGSFELQSTFYDVNVVTNDRNKEILLYADHTGVNELYNGAGFGYVNGEAPENYASWLTTWNYTNFRSSGTATLTREIIPWGGRPWTGLAPVQEVFRTTNLNTANGPTFADKTNDSRYDGTFAIAFRANWTKFSGGTGTATNANSMQIKDGEVVLTLLPDETLTASITFPTDAGTNAVGAGEISSRADYVLPPSYFSRLIYPNLWKIGPMKANTESGYGNTGAASVRPWNIAKLSELYFIAAEAAVKGATAASGKSARELINVIRARAGKWSFSNAENAAKTDDNSATLTTATPNDIDIDYILAERSREYFGEGYRWLDLVRTQTWDRIAAKYTICAADPVGSFSRGATTLKEVTRTIDKNKHYLRPIPTGQLDGLEMTAEEKSASQNPEW
jgi:hypothetical protein